MNRSGSLGAIAAIAFVVLAGGASGSEQAACENMAAALSSWIEIVEPVTIHGGGTPDDIRNELVGLGFDGEELAALTDYFVSQAALGEALADYRARATTALAAITDCAAGEG